MFMETGEGARFSDAMKHSHAIRVDELWIYPIQIKPKIPRVYPDDLHFYYWVDVALFARMVRAYLTIGDAEAPTVYTTTVNIEDLPASEPLDRRGLAHMEALLYDFAYEQGIPNTVTPTKPETHGVV
jgi:hypothetical protein